jgi:hypothetical protein
VTKRGLFERALAGYRQHFDEFSKLEMLHETLARMGGGVEGLVIHHARQLEREEAALQWMFERVNEAEAAGEVG